MQRPTVLRNFVRHRFDPRRVRINAARAAELARSRAARIGELIGRATPFDLPTQWLTLRPEQMRVEGKGWLEFTSPSTIGMGQFDDGSYMYAAFDLIFEKDLPNETSIERPGLAIRLDNPPAKTMLVELDLHAHDGPPGNPTFEIVANGQQTLSVPEGQRETIMFLMHDSATIRSTWANGKEFWNKDGNWAFFEARISPVT